jgi:hypothetical protein
MGALRCSKFTASMPGNWFVAVGAALRPPAFSRVRAVMTPLVDLTRTSWPCWKGHVGDAKPGREVNAQGESDDA